MTAPRQQLRALWFTACIIGGILLASYLATGGR